VTVLFGDGVPEIFSELKPDIKRQAARSIDLLATHPRMYPVRRRGLMRGYRYFIAGGFPFYYSIASTEVRITAIIPAAMRQA
jgi:plasmid stabilization system protein ParE